MQMPSLFIMKNHAAIAKAAVKPSSKKPAGPEPLFGKGSPNEIAIEDIGGVSAGKGGLMVEHKDGSKRVIAPEAAAEFLTWHGQHLDAMEQAAQAVDPEATKALTLDQSVQNINGERQNWLMDICKDVDSFTGLRSQCMPAVGMWRTETGEVDTENATFIAIAKVPDEKVLQYAAALKGMAANQKAVLSIRLDPRGADTLCHVSIPHDTSTVSLRNNLQRIQQVMELEQLDEAVFVRTPNGTDVVFFEAGNSTMVENVKRLAMFFGATGEVSKCVGEFIDSGEEGDGIEASQNYRSIIYQFEKTNGVKYEFKELPPEDMTTKPGPMPRGFGGTPGKIKKSLGGLGTLRTIVGVKVATGSQARGK